MKDFTSKNSRKIKRNKKQRKNSSETNLHDIKAIKNQEPRMIDFLYDKNDEKTRSAFAIGEDLTNDKRRKNNETFYQTMKRPRKNPYSRSYSSYHDFTKATLNDSLPCEINNESKNDDSGIGLDTSITSEGETTTNDETFNEYDCSTSCTMEEESRSLSDEELIKPLEAKITASMSDIRTLSLESLKSENQQYLETPTKRRKYKSKSDSSSDKYDKSPKHENPAVVLRSKQKESVKSKQQAKRTLSERGGTVRMRKKIPNAFPEEQLKRLSLQDPVKGVRSKKVHRSTTLYWENDMADETNVENLVFKVSMGARIQSRFNDTILHSAATNGQLDIVKFYVDKNQYLNEQNGYLNTALHCATFHKHNDIIDVLLEYNADLNIQNVEGDTALHLACDKELTEVVRKFIEKGCLLNVENENGETPLHIAVHRKRLETTKMLIENGADMTIKNNHGNTPLHSAIHYFATKDTIQLLVDKIEEIREEETQKRPAPSFTISWCAEDDSLVTSEAELDNKIEDLVDSGTEADYESPAGINSTEYKDFCVVEFDSKIQHPIDVTDIVDGSKTSVGKMDFAEFSRNINASSEMNIQSNEPTNHSEDMSLDDNTVSIEDKVTEGTDTIEESANQSDMINIRNSGGDTLLIRAVKYCSNDVVEMILNCSNIDINVVNNKGNSALHCAAILPDVNIVKLIMKRENDILDVKNGIGNTALHCATERGNQDTVDYLLRREANANLPNFAGNTPIHCAVLTNQVMCLKKLLQYNANISIYNDEGKLPLHCAVENVNIEISNILIEFSNKHVALAVNTKTKSRMSPIHIVLMSDHSEETKIEMLDILLDNGADINDVDNNGNTILHIALTTNKDNIIKAILTHNVRFNVQNNDGDTVLHLISRNNRMDIISGIKGSSSDLSVKNKKGLTPLNVALQLCYGDMAMLLLNMAWDLDFKF